MSQYFGVATDEVAQIKIGAPLSIAVMLTLVTRISVSLTPVSVGAATCAEQDFAVTGLAVGDSVDLTPPAITAGVAPVCTRVKSAGIMTVTFCNPTAGALVPAAGVYRIKVVRS